MVPRITATIESVRNALAVMEIDELMPVMVNGAVLYYRTTSIEPVEPEWEIELA